MTATSGHTAKELVQRLTAAGIVSSMKKPLTVLELRYAFAAPFYTGMLRYRGQESTMTGRRESKTGRLAGPMDRTPAARQQNNSPA